MAAILGVGISSALGPPVISAPHRDALSSLRGLAETSFNDIVSNHEKQVDQKIRSSGSSRDVDFDVGRDDENFASIKLISRAVIRHEYVFNQSYVTQLNGVDGDASLTARFPARFNRRVRREAVGSVDLIYDPAVNLLTAN